MKAITFKKFGGPEVLEIQDIEIGKPGQKKFWLKTYLSV
jgi:NADPH2:quinone reductase